LSLIYGLPAASASVSALSLDNSAENGIHDISEMRYKPAVDVSVEPVTLESLAGEDRRPERTLRHSPAPEVPEDENLDLRHRDAKFSEVSLPEVPSHRSSNDTTTYGTSFKRDAWVSEFGRYASGETPKSNLFAFEIKRSDYSQLTKMT
jgi:hypothetical protein